MSLLEDKDIVFEEEAKEQKSLHTICMWSFNPGKGGFVPADMRPEWAGIDSARKIRLIGEQIAPRLPSDVRLGVEAHYDGEVNEASAQPFLDALAETGMVLGMITPGAHSRFGYGGIASLDSKERKAAEEFGARTVDLAYGPLRPAWDPKVVPTFVLWNGSWGYDVESPAIAQMLQNVKSSVADLVHYEQSNGGLLYKAIEPKANEGHPAMLLGTVGEAMHFWDKLVRQHGLDRTMLGVNKEFGHTEMIGLDIISETAQEIDDGQLVHMHLNHQGGKSGLLGGSGKYDIDNGVQINEATIAVAYLVAQSGYARWKGHDMQARSYDNEQQAADRVVRSVLSWEASAQAAKQLDYALLMSHLAERRTAPAQDMMGDLVSTARASFKQMYQK